MAHSPRRKAAALAMLILGERPPDVAQALGIPRSTVIRWRDNDLQTYLRPIVAASPALQQAARSLQWLDKMDTKKRKYSCIHEY